MNYKTRQPFPHVAYVEGQRNFTYFDRSLTSGLTDVVIESPGDFLYIDQASTGAVSVELNMRQGGTLAPILLAAGGSIECDFASIKINAAAQLNKTIRVIVGNGARIKGGAVVNASSQIIQVINGGPVTALANKGFAGYAYSAASAAKYSHAQVFNPAGSGKNAFVEALLITSYISGLHIWATHNVAASNLMAASTMGNKNAAGANSSSKLRYEENAVQLFTAVHGAAYISANTTLQIPLQTPVCLPPGYGLTVIPSTANAAVAASFNVIEE